MFMIYLNGKMMHPPTRDKAPVGEYGLMVS
jgi:hypothetical protein